MTRILLLMAAADWASAAEALRNARETAAHPESLTYGLSLDVQPDEGEQAEMHALGAVMYLAPGHDAWTDMDQLWQGEPYVLLGVPEMRFGKRWDHQLLQSMRWCCKASEHDDCVLTGYLPRETDPVDAVSPVAAERIDRRGRLCFTKGTPLRYALHPQVSAFLHPDFCFAPSAFFRMMKEAEAPLFLEAYMTGWELYTLHKPLIHLLGGVEDELAPVNVSCCQEMEGIARFETRFGVHFAQRRLGGMAKCGIFNPDLTFDSRVPIGVRVQELLRGIGSSKQASPLCVTAWLTVQGHPLSAAHMQRFRRMAAMKNLPLISFVDRESAAKVERSHPEIQEFQPRHGLDVPVEAIVSDEQTYVRLSKPFMLAQCRQQSLRYSHYVWLNFDYMRYPVYEGETLDWHNVCDDCINIGMVDHQLDLSMIVVPEERVEPLCREISMICNRNWQRGNPLPTEQEVWIELYGMHGEWFHVHQLPGSHELLSLTMPLRGEEINTK